MKKLQSQILRKGTRLLSSTCKRSLADDRQQLIQTILNCTASKREARSYLSKYSLLESNNIYNDGQYKDKAKSDSANESNSASSSGIVEEAGFDKFISNVLTDDIVTSNIELMNARSEGNVHISGGSGFNEIKLTECIRACIIRINISDLKLWSNDKYDNFGQVLKTCLKLGASPLIIINMINSAPIEMNSDIKKEIDQIKNKLNDRLEEFVQLRILEGTLEIEKNDIYCAIPSILGVPLFSGNVPIIFPTAVDTKDLKTKIVNSSKATRAIVKGIMGLNESNKTKDDVITVEKVVFIDDTIGGIPSIERGQNSCHVFINVQQEFDSILDELSPISANQSNKGKINWIDDKLKIEKLKSFKEMSKLLKKLPQSTGIMTTSGDLTKVTNDQEPNPLIYSILTDRATQSSSLPVGFGQTKEVNTTILKWGTPIHIITSKSLRSLGLNSCVKHQYCVDLVKLDQMNIVSCSKLKDLIEDSFKKKFDWDHYMERIKDKIAAIIFTNDYSSGCIVTYEFNPEMAPEGEDISDYWIPYLDKFAVVRAQQGEPGLADVIFKTLLQQFPEELVWRSRKTNPVNKWYFERSVGTVGIENSLWRVFYTGWKNEEWDKERIDNYIDICRDIKPSFVQQ